MRRASILLAMAAMLLFLASMALAKEIAFLENGNLVISEVKMIVPDVPEGISAETAHKLVTGEIKEAVIRDQAGKKTYVFSYPIMEEKVFSDTVAAYSGGKWIQNPLPLARTEKSSNWLLTITWLWIPALGILTVSLLNAFFNISKRKLLVFYLAMFAGILAGMLVGTSAGGPGVFAGLLTGVFAGGFAGFFACGFAGLFVGGFAGGFAGMLTGGFAGLSAGGFDYMIFLLAVEAVCFLASLLAGAIKNI